MANELAQSVENVLAEIELERKMELLERGFMMLDLFSRRADSP